MGVLVVKDPVNPLLQTRKTQAPGLLGMNIISGCYDKLFCQHGSSLFQTDLVRQAGAAKNEALSECHRIDCLFLGLRFILLPLCGGFCTLCSPSTSTGGYFAARLKTVLCMPYKIAGMRHVREPFKN